MTRDEQIAFIEKRCVEANAAIETRTATVSAHRTSYTGRDTTIRLADVLLAIADLPKISLVLGEGKCAIMQHPKIGGAYWNLRKDDLTEQSDECIAFLADLLK